MSTSFQSKATKIKLNKERNKQKKGPNNYSFRAEKVKVSNRKCPEGQAQRPWRRCLASQSTGTDFPCLHILKTEEMDLATRSPPYSQSIKSFQEGSYLNCSLSMRSPTKATLKTMMSMLQTDQPLGILC